MRSIRRVVVCAALLGAASACEVEKAPVDDDLTGQMAGGKADSIGVAGTLSFGQSSAVAHEPPPRYAAYQFVAGGGDTIDVRVRSLSGGDPVTWVINAQGTVLGMNDDASSASLDSRVQLAMPSGPGAVHYVVFRDYYEDAGTYRVTLGGQHDLLSCERDSDCARIEAGCCAVGDYVAIRGDRAAEYTDSLDCSAVTCPVQPIEDLGETALCDNNSHTCEILVPAEIQCGGHSLNPHGCPGGWECVGPDLQVDGTGDCAETCGGFANQPCPAGWICEENPFDDCDPSMGADCSGICT